MACQSTLEKMNQIDKNSKRLKPSRPVMALQKIKDFQTGESVLPQAPIKIDTPSFNIITKELHFEDKVKTTKNIFRKPQ